MGETDAPAPPARPGLGQAVCMHFDEPGRAGVNCNPDCSPDRCSDVLLRVSVVDAQQRMLQLRQGLPHAYSPVCRVTRITEFLIFEMWAERAIERTSQSVRLRVVAYRVASEAV